LISERDMTPERKDARPLRATIWSAAWRAVAFILLIVGAAVLCARFPS
jgi:hypothetical protein